MDQHSDHQGQKARQEGHDDEVKADQQSVEANPRFPSGPWSGYILVPPERCPQSMRMTLTFRDASITGIGNDLQGDFSVIGTYGHDGNIQFEKRYVDGRMLIRFDGHHVDQDRFWGFSGDWVLDQQWRERFWISPVVEGD